MTAAEKVAYLRGLADGLDVDKASKEGKLFLAALDVMDALVEELQELQDCTQDLSLSVDALREDLDDVEDWAFTEDDDEDGCSGDCDSCPGCDGCFGDVDNEEGEDTEENGEDDYAYEATCPNCNIDFAISEDAMALGKVCCPSCGEEFELELEDEEE